MKNLMTLLFLILAFTATAGGINEKQIFLNSTAVQGNDNASITSTSSPVVRIGVLNALNSADYKAKAKGPSAASGIVSFQQVGKSYVSQDNINIRAQGNTGVTDLNITANNLVNQGSFKSVAIPCDTDCSGNRLAYVNTNQAISKSSVDQSNSRVTVRNNTADTVKASLLNGVNVASSKAIVKGGNANISVAQTVFKSSLDQSNSFVSLTNNQATGDISVEVSNLVNYEVSEVVTSGCMTCQGSGSVFVSSDQSVVSSSINQLNTGVAIGNAVTNIDPSITMTNSINSAVVLARP